MASRDKPEFVKAGYWLADDSNTLDAKDINTDLFTHVFFGFADIDPITKKVIISSSSRAKVLTFSDTIKRKASDVKTLLSIGGGGSDPKSFALMAGQSAWRKAFIDSSIDLAREHNFDGLDLQWLYPSTQTEMNTLGTLFHEWNDAIVAESHKSSNPQLVLVATVFYSAVHNLPYPIDKMKSSLDWINVQAYDFYTPQSSTDKTGPSATFFNSISNNLSASYGIQEWISKDYPAQSIVIGLPFYGWAWLLTDASKHIPFSPANGPASSISDNGRVDFKNIIQLIQKFETKPVHDNHDIFTYTYYSTNWISYDDEITISAKISKLKNLNLLGYFASNIEDDDEFTTLATTASEQWDA